MGDRPQKGIIAGGLRVLTQETILTKYSGALGRLVNGSLAQEELFNYIYSNVIFPKTTNFIDPGSSTNTPFS